MERAKRVVARRRELDSRELRARLDEMKEQVRAAEAGRADAARAAEAGRAAAEAEKAQAEARASGLQTKLDFASAELSDTVAELEA